MGKKLQGSEKTGGAMAGRLSKIDIPSFNGNMREYKLWRQRFVTLTRDSDPETRKIYLINSLKGEAYKWVESLIIDDKSIAEIWAALESHFGNEKHIVDATIKKLLSIPKCQNSIRGLQQHFIESINAATGLVNLGLNIEQLLASMYILQIPGDF